MKFHVFRQVNQIENGIRETFFFELKFKILPLLLGYFDFLVLRKINHIMRTVITETFLFEHTV